MLQKWQLKVHVDLLSTTAQLTYATIQLSEKICEKIGVYTWLWKIDKVIWFIDDLSSFFFLKEKQVIWPEYFARILLDTLQIARNNKPQLFQPSFPSFQFLHCSNSFTYNTDD